MKKHLSLASRTALFLLPLSLISQSTPVSLRPDVKVELIMKVKQRAARVAMDPVTNTLYYITSIGKVYAVKNLLGSAYDTLLYTEANHGIAYLQGMTFIDSALFLIGNKMIDSTGSRGLVKKAVLQPNGSRTWHNVMTTDVYPQSYTWYDHGFSGIVASPDKQYLYISSGSRTDHGEIQSNNGLYPGLREVPLTSAIFKIPANSNNLTLPNTDAGIAPYLYADGVRNSFDLAFDPDGKLFAVENSGDRDDPDELNWIREGRHYGFPWTMGGNNNPQQFSPYDPNNDPLLNVQSHCYLHGYYGNDPSFPPKGTLLFTPPVKNVGPDADNFRENTGKVRDGSESGQFISSFTPHRSPLGLSFDRNKMLGSDFNGRALAASFTRKGDSTGLDKYGSPGTIVDAGQDLLLLNLQPDGNGEYKMNVTTIVNNFNYPVDTYLDGNILYLIEYNDGPDGRLFRVTLPAGPIGVTEMIESKEGTIYPNPGNGLFNLEWNNGSEDASICVYDILGNCVYRNEKPQLSMNPGCAPSFCIDLRNNAKGVYMLSASSSENKIVKKLVID
jgi:glucose/arabinose dehydrogenase